MLRDMTSYLLAIAMYSILRFENQRWFRARANGMRGSNESIGNLVDATFFLGSIFTLAFFLAYLFDYGLLKTGVAFATGFGAALVWAFVSKDTIASWVLSTIFLWPAMIYLATLVTWFGINS